MNKHRGTILVDANSGIKLHREKFMRIVIMHAPFNRCYSTVRKHVLARIARRRISAINDIFGLTSITKIKLFQNEL